MDEEHNQVPVVIVPGNGYSSRHMKKFISFLMSQPWCDYVVYIELLENLYEDLSYDRLKPAAYSKYIYERLPDKTTKYIFYGTSMGCYHIQNFLKEHPGSAHSVIWLEPTMCGGDFKLLKQFEEGRGNGQWLQSLYDIPYDIKSLPSNEKVIDIAVSTDLNNDFDVNIPLGIIYTSVRNDGEIYTLNQQLAKDAFIDELERKGHHIEYQEIRAPHSADIYPEFFPLILDMIVKVSF